MYRKIVKPTLDFIIALILIIIFLPLMGIVALVTLIDLGLPLHNLLREREGLNRKTFIMYKFRTKALDPDGTTRSNTFTKVSRFIDRTRLNELPQLFNVLFGQMSLVGPRPFIPSESGQFEDLIDPKRYMVKPGMTGLAQVSGGRTITNERKLQYDVEYYDNLSFMLDLKIIVKTVLQTVGGVDNRKNRPDYIQAKKEEKEAKAKNKATKKVENVQSNKEANKVNTKTNKNSNNNKNNSNKNNNSKSKNNKTNKKKK